MTTQSVGRQSERRQPLAITLRIGLAGVHILGGDQGLEVLPQSGLAQHQFDLPP